MDKVGKYVPQVRACIRNTPTATVSTINVRAEDTPAADEPQRSNIPIRYLPARLEYNHSSVLSVPDVNASL